MDMAAIEEVDGDTRPVMAGGIGHIVRQSGRLCMWSHVIRAIMASGIARIINPYMGIITGHAHAKVLGFLCGIRFAILRSMQLVTPHVLRGLPQARWGCRNKCSMTR